MVEGSEEILSRDALEKAWIRVKKRYPLIGAKLDEHTDADRVDFVVREEDLSTIRGDVHSLDVESFHEVEARIEHLMNVSYPLNNSKLAEIHVLCRKDVPRQFHLLLVVAHVITDGMASGTLVRQLCQELSLPSYEPIPSLPLRLEVVPALEDLYPSRFMNLSKQRWHQAIARVIFNIRNSKLKVCGSTYPG